MLWLTSGSLKLKLRCVQGLGGLSCLGQKHYSAGVLDLRQLKKKKQLGISAFEGR